MGRKTITDKLSVLLEKHLNPDNNTRIYMSREVTFDYGTDHSIRVDYMKFVPINNTVSGIEKGDFYCYEVKSSVEDFHSKNGHNFIGDYNYYVMPLDVYEKIKDEIPYHVGVYVLSVDEFGNEYLESIKKVKRTDRNRPALEMLLMMFRSANRDANIRRIFDGLLTTTLKNFVKQHKEIMRGFLYNDSTDFMMKWCEYETNTDNLLKEMIGDKNER